jgi:CHAD domain-containing protein
MRAYVQHEVSSRLARLVFEMRRSLRGPDPEAIHDLRVAIRRFGESLRVFGDYLPRREVKRVRRRLREMLDSAAEVRNRDISLDLCRQAKVPAGAVLPKRLARERAGAAQHFGEIVKRLMERDLATHWRSRLEL